MNLLVDSGHRPRSRARWIGGLDYWRYLVRTVSLGPLALAGPAGVVLALGGFRSSIEQSLVSVLVASGAATLLDDRASPLVAGSPMALWWRRATRLALGLPVAAAIWLALWALADALGPTWSPVHLEVVTMTLVVIGAGAVTIRRTSDGRAGPVGPPIALLMVASQFVLPAGWDIYPVSAHEPRWWAMTAVAVLTLALATRDPARRTWRTPLATRSGQ